MCGAADGKLQNRVSTIPFSDKVESLRAEFDWTRPLDESVFRIIDKRQHHEPEDVVLHILQRWCIFYPETAP